MNSPIKISARMPLDGIVRRILFPLAVVFALSALGLAVKTYNDLQESSISSAFATVQSVQEAYSLRKEYPTSVVLSSADRHFERFWVVSSDGIIKASNEADSVGTRIDPSIWALTDSGTAERLLQDYVAGDRTYMIAGQKAADGSHWTIVQLSPPLAFTTVIWLILAVLALSLMSVSAVIAVRYLYANGETIRADIGKARSLTGRPPSARSDLSNWHVRSDGTPTFLEDETSDGFTNLHEAVLRAKDDYVIVLDGDQRLIYSNPALQLTDTERLVGIDVLTAFADRHFDDRARARFENWLGESARARSIVLDVRESDGKVCTTRWSGHLMEMHSGSRFEVYVGQRLAVEEFPEPL